MRLVDRYKKPSLNDFYGAQKRSQSIAAAPAQWLIDALQAQSNHSGQPVNEKTALSIGAVHACVRVISEGLASMPFKLYEVSGRDKTQDKTSPAAKLISQPNPYNTWINFMKYMAAGAIYRGNAYAYIFRDGAGNPVNLLPLQNCTVVPMLGGGNLFYDVQTLDPIYKDIPKIVSSYDILHIKGLCISNQFTAINPIQYHAETFGIDLAAMASLSTSFKTGTKKFMLASEKGWSNDQQVATRDSMETVLRNEKIVFSVPSGVSAQSISLTPQEAGYIEAMGFTAKDIARIFGVPASIIGADDGAIKGSVEQDSLNFLNQTLHPWAVNIEAEFKMKLVSEKDKPNKFFKFNFNSLMRADAAARGEFYSKMLLNGVLNRNEVRDLEDLNPYSDGDEYMVPFNEVAASQFTAITQAKIDAMEKTMTQNNNPNGNN